MAPPARRDDDEATRDNLHGVHDAMRWLLHWHPACNRILHGLVARRAGEAPKFHALRPSAHAPHAETVNEFLRRVGGVRFKTDTTGTAIARTVVMVPRAPVFALSRLPGYVWRWRDRLHPGAPMQALGDLIAGRLEVQPLVIVGHHVMSRDELRSDDGRQRLVQCDSTCR